MPQTQSNYWYIRSHELFQHLSDQDYKEVEWIAKFKKCKRNEILYLPDEDNRNVYFVKNGYVKLGLYDAEGNEIILDILKKGDIFGEISFGMRKNNEEFAVALTNETVLCNFDIKKLEGIFLKRPEMAVHFSKKIGERQLSITRRFSNILYKDARERLLDFFYDLTISNGDGSKENIVLENYLTHNDLAHLNGLARPTVTSLLNQFKDEGLLEMDRKNIRIPSLSKLKK